MTDDRFRELNVYRPLVLTLERDDAITGDPEAIDVSGADHISLTVRNRQDRSTLLVDHEAMAFVTDGTDGQVSYTFSAEELAVATSGRYEIQVEIFWTVDGPSEDVAVDDGFVVSSHFGTHA